MAEGAEVTKEKALYADVAWLKGVLEGRLNPSPGGRGLPDESLVEAARECRESCDRLLEAFRTKSWTPEDFEAERNGGGR